VSDSADLNYFVWLCGEITSRLEALPADPFPIGDIRGLLDEANQRARKQWGQPVAEVHETLAGCWIKIVVPDSGEVQHPLWTLEVIEAAGELATTVHDREGTESPEGVAVKRDLIYALGCWLRRALRPHAESPPPVRADDEVAE